MPSSSSVLYVHPKLAALEREPKLSVQMLVMVKNHTNSYDVLRIIRSSYIAAKAGYLQFVPSGGFE